MSVEVTQHRVHSSNGDRAHAVLYLEGQEVGTVEVKGRDSSGGYGDFTPNGEFATYAQAFGLWSLLMHADEDGSRLSPAASSELASAENALDAIKARLFFPAQVRWVEVAQLTIDGELLEWREY